MLTTHGFEFHAKGWERPVRVPACDVPRDPSLPDLATFLDADAMSRRIAAELGDGTRGDYALTEGSLVYLRYKPSRYCNAFYDLRLENSAGTSRRHYLIFAKLLSKELENQAHKQTVELKTPAQSANRVVYTTFPTDSKVASLARLSSRLELQNRLRAALDDDSLVIDRQHGHKKWAQVLSYRPERYFLIKIAVKSSKRACRQIVARLFHDQRDATVAWRFMQALWSNHTRGIDSPLVPQPLGYVEQDRMCIYDVAPGKMLAELLCSANSGSLLRSAGELLARIHRCPIPEDVIESMTLVGSKSILSKLISVRSTLNNIEQIDQKLLDVVVSSLRDTVPTAQHKPCILHGDFSPNQIVVDKQILTAIDFSGVYGDVYVDLGNFLLRLRNVVTASQWHLARAEFLRSYASSFDIAIDEKVLAWYEAAAMVKDALIPMKKIRADWPVHSTTRLNTALRLL